MALNSKKSDMKIEPPKYLNERAREIFLLVLPQLAGDLLPSDVLRLGAYAQSASEYEQLTETVNAEGTTVEDRDGDERRSPDALARAKAFDQWCKSEVSLGLERKQRVKGDQSKGRRKAKSVSLRKAPRNTGS